MSLRRIVGKFERGDADAGRHLERADPLAGIEGRRGDTLPQPLADEIGLGEVRIRHDHDELLAAEAAGQIDAANIASQAHGEFPQHRIARVMPMAVVDRLEMIDVKHQHR